MHDHRRCPTRRLRTDAAFAALLMAVATSAWAGTQEIGPADDWQAAMHALQPGDTLILDGGTYTLNGFFSLALSGSAALPIVIRAQEGAQPLLQQLNISNNVLTLDSASYLTVDGLEITGNGIGIRIGAADHLTIRNCHIHGTTAEPITASLTGSDYAGLAFVHNEIDHGGGTGVGMYLGCSTDDCRVHDSLVANNYIHDLGDAGFSLNYGILLRHGSYANTIRDNVIRDTLYASIAVADANAHGASNVIEGNLLWHAQADFAVQLTADAIVRNNVVLANSGYSGIYANAAVAPLGNLQIVNNTVISTAGGIRVNGVSGAVTIANNAIYAPSGNAIQASTTGAGAVTVLANAGQGSLSGVASGFTATGDLAADFFAANTSGGPPQNLVPKGSLLPGAADAGTLASADFMSLTRATPDIGAYQANGSGNPGWRPAAAFKIVDQIFVGDFQAWP